MTENPKHETRNSKQARMDNMQNPKRVERPAPAFGPLAFGTWDLSRISRFGFRISVVWAVALGLLLAGCAAKPERLRVCPGKASAEEALQTLAARAESAVPLRANGQGLLTFYPPNKKKPERHNLPLKMWFDPPADVYIQGTVAVDAKAVILGSNDQEFWLALRPKEMSSYYLGQWQDVQGFEGLMMSPRVVLEALGIVVQPGGELNAALWSLQNKGPYDVLTRRDEAGRFSKRLYVYSCDYVVHKIEYYDRQGKLIATATLGDYRPVTDQFSVPTRIAVESIGPDKRNDSIRISLSSLKPMKFSEAQRRGLFVPPSSERFEHVYRYEEGRWVPE
jgi:hypothetical protein